MDGFDGWKWVDSVEKSKPKKRSRKQQPDQQQKTGIKGWSENQGPGGEALIMEAVDGRKKEMKLMRGVKYCSNERYYIPPDHAGSLVVLSCAKHIYSSCLH